MKSYYSSISNKNVLVTGGLGGIGTSIMNCFKEQKANVYITGTKRNKLVTGINYIKCDFDNSKEFEFFLSSIKELEIDILVNNAGINKIDKFQNIKKEDFIKIHKVNTFAPFRITQEVLHNMKKRKWGRIVNISSIFGNISKEYRASYSSSKFALDGLTAALSAEVAKNGILVNTVSPGFIKTDLTQKILGSDGIKEMSSLVPIGRLGRPVEIAKFIIWLCSDENSYISGQNLIIDGGFSRV